MFLLLIAFTTQTFSQNIGKIRGTITDEANGEVLAFGNVLIEELNIGVSTNNKGYYYISSLPVNTNVTLIVSYVGYESKKIVVFVYPNKINKLDIQLSSSSVVLQTVEKIGEKVVEKNETDIGLQRISGRELEAMPKGVETDVFRSLQYVPGVNFTADMSARYYVRGGDSNQNLVLLNGANVYNSFHAMGLFSIIDPEMINTMEFYKGGYTAEYGGRLSSVLNLITKDGNRTRYSGKAAASFLTAKAVVEGPIPYGSFIITGRKSHSTSILKKFFNNQTAPFNFYDASFKINFSNPNFLSGSKFVVHGFLSEDKLEFDNPLREDYNWTNNILGFSWFQVYDVPLFSEISYTTNNFQGKVFPNLSSTREKESKLSEHKIDMNYNYIFDNKNEIYGGLQITILKTQLYMENLLGAYSDINKKGINLSFFLKYKLLQYDEFGLDLGLRYSLAGLTRAGTGFIEPRISFTYTPNPVIAFKAFWGRFQQEITTISNENEVINVFEPYILVPEYLKIPKAEHYNAGVTFYFTDKISLVSEVYYKKSINITEINYNKKYASDQDLVSGEAESYGLEHDLNYSNDMMHISVGYTLAYSYKKVNNWTYYPRYDSRHSLNCALEVNIGSGWKSMLTWTYKSGLPYTPIIGYYEKLFFQPGAFNTSIYNYYFPYSVLGDKNSTRLPSYHRMDIGISKIFDLNYFRLYVDASITNVYNRKNLFYFDRSTGERINMLPFFVSVNVKVEI
ncbi:MAG: TonB-dependent receptor [Bacteroidetes bacterium]|nr:TonB-dependent receptor [Bacteroidota bacterium]